MLQIPGKKFSRSVNVINIDTNTLADWIEASLMFDENEISKSDVVDLLIEENICSDDGQDLAHEIADRGWAEIGTRKSWGGGPDQLVIAGARIKDAPDWRHDPIRALFLVLSIQQYYSEWAERHRNFSVQGELFERVIEELCPGLLPGWQVVRAGWSPDNAVSIVNIVEELCGHLNTLGSLRLDQWVPDAAKDGGLDIVCYRRFPDNREATPTYFLQCASGTNWRNKIHTPSANEWQKYLDAAVQPSTGIVAPFVIGTDEVRRAGLSGQITVFDRIRLLHATYDKNIELSEDLRADVIAWVEGKVGDIPTL